MANTTLSSIGGVLQDSRANELIVGGVIGDTSTYPGMLVGVLSTSVMEAFDVDSGSADILLGIVLPRYDQDMDSVTTAVPYEVVVPQPGHLYGLKIDTAQAGACEMGWSLILHATSPGILDEATNVEDDHVAKYYKIAAGDTFAIILWGY